MDTMPMADNPSTVIITVTDYTTILPTTIPSVTDLESFPVITQTRTIEKLSSISPTLQASTFRTSARFSSSSILIQNPSSSSSLQSRTSLSTSQSFSPTSIAPSTPSAPPDTLFEQHPNNVVPILMLILLVLIAFLFCGALLYFVYRLFLGECKDCIAKNAELIRLKTRLGPEMVRERAGHLPISDHAPVNAISLEPGQEITLPRAVYERGVRIVKAEKKSDPGPSSEARSGPSIHDGAPIPPVSAAFTDSLHWRTLSEEQNRSQAFRELNRPHPETFDQPFEEVKQPFWKRILDRTGIANYGRSPGVAHPVPQDFAGRYKRPEMRVRTASNPGPAPEPPTVPTPAHRMDETNPYKYNFRAGFVDAERSRTVSSDAVPGKYAQPVAQGAPQEFITIALAPPTPRTAAFEEAEHARLTELRRQMIKRRTMGYGGFGP